MAAERCAFHASSVRDERKDSVAGCISSAALPRVGQAPHVERCPHLRSLLQRSGYQVPGYPLQVPMPCCARGWGRPRPLVAVVSLCAALRREGKGKGSSSRGYSRSREFKCDGGEGDNLGKQWNISIRISDLRGQISHPHPVISDPTKSDIIN